MSSFREIKQEWDRPVDMEWNKAEKRWQPMVFDDYDDYDDDDDDDDYSDTAAPSPSSFSSSSFTVTTSTMGDRNNSSNGVVQALRRCMQRCGNCSGCRKEDCGECKRCKTKKKFGGPGSIGACIHRPCENLVASSSSKKREAAAAAAAGGGTGDDDDLPDPTTIPKLGDRVYCRWPETDMWYWGHVVKEFQHYGQTKYAVDFDDGDHRTKVPVVDMLVEEEYYRLHPNEKKRKTSKDGVSLSSASTAASMASSIPATTSSDDPPFHIAAPLPRPRGRPAKKTKNQQAPGGGGELAGGPAAAHPCNKPTTTAVVVAAAAWHRHRHGGDSLGGKNKSASFDSTLDVGSRVWARFSGNNGFYWGHITKMSGEGILTKYSVLFSDGDTEDNIRCEYVYSEAEYFGHPNLKSTDGICQECALCLKNDCGTCEACDTNRRSTQTSKYCCLFKTCAAFDIDRRAQSIPGLPEWKFYFDDEQSSSPKSTPLHPKLSGLRILPPPGTIKIYGSLEAAVRKKVLDDATATNAAQLLYEKWLGLHIRVPVNNHELIGKRFCRQWLDVSGKPKALFGHIVSCERHYFEGEHLSFQVEYDEECLSLIDSARGFDAPVMEFEEVSETLAWGGFALFQEKAAKIPSQLRAAQAPPLKWLLPDMIQRTLLPPDVASNEKQRPKLSIIFRGFRLVLEARQSDIPNAGLGVFLTCFSTSAFLYNMPQEFVLPAGELLDIGLYAPLRHGDLKDIGVHVLKNFIQHGATEVYSFDISGPDKGKKVFDITDDLTSELHVEAWQNVPSFVNETDGMKTPTIHALHDPHGSVHYLLGHQPDHVVPFRVPLGKAIEVKIDYGATYERVRVRKKYSRLNDAERCNMEQSILNDDSETLSDINGWSVVDVEESVAFLASLQFKQSSDSAGRALLVATLLLRRLFVVQKEFSKLSRTKLAAPDSYCDNGYSTMDETKIVERAIAVVLQLLRLWDNKEEALEQFFWSSEAFVYYLAKAVATSMATVKKLNGGEMQKKIQALCSTN